MTTGALLARVATAGATALGLGVLCGVALVSDPAPPPPEPVAATEAAPPAAAAPPRVVEPVVEVAPPAAPAAEAAPLEPVDLVRALPDALAMAQLAAILSGPDHEAAVEVAHALAVAPSPEGRALLVAHLSRPVVDAPGLEDLACLEALAVIGQAGDLTAVLPWARRGDTAGVVAAWCVRTICERERVEPPEGLREVETPTRSRTDEGA